MSLTLCICSTARLSVWEWGERGPVARWMHPLVLVIYMHLILQASGDWPLNMETKNLWQRRRQKHPCSCMLWPCSALWRLQRLWTISCIYKRRQLGRLCTSRVRSHRGHPTLSVPLPGGFEDNWRKNRPEPASPCRVVLPDLLCKISTLCWFDTRCRGQR